MMTFSGKSIASTIQADSLSKPKTYGLTKEGAQQALLDHRKVEDLTQQVTVLTELVRVQNDHIDRQERIISELSFRSTEIVHQLSGKPISVPDPPTIKVQTADRRKLFWARAENWGWRVLAAATVVLAVTH